MGTTSLLPVAMNCILVYTSCKWNYTKFVLLSLAYFIEHKVFKDDPGCSVCQNFLMVKQYSIIGVHHILFSQSSADEHFDFFHFLAIVNNVTMSTGAQVSVQVPTFNSLGSYPDVELLDHMVSLCFFVSLRNHDLFSTVAAPFYISTTNAQGSNFLTSNDCFLGIKI